MVLSILVQTGLSLPAGEEIAPVLPFRTFDRGSWPNLPQNTITILQQDSRGILWIGTQDGVATFDGNELKSLSDDPAVPSRGLIINIGVGPQRVVVSSPAGLHIYDYRRWQRLDIPAPIIRTCLDLKNQIWAQAISGELFKLEESGDTRGWQKPEPPYPERCDLFYIGNDGKFFTVENHRVYQVSGSEKKQILTPEDLKERVTAFFISRSQQIVLGTETGRVFISDPEGRNWSGIFVPEWPAVPINRIIEDGEGFLWMAGTAKGIIRGNLSTGWRMLTSKNGLAEATVSCLLADREGQVWIGYNGAGMQQLLSRNWTHRNALEVNGSAARPVSVFAITRKQSGGFLAALFSLGLWDWDTRGMRHYSEKDGLRDDVRFAIEPRPGVIWAACRFGIYEKIGSGKFHKTFHLPRGLVTSFLRTPSGTWLAGTSTAGLLRLNHRGQWEYADEMNGELVDHQIRAMALCGENIWVGTMTGITIFRPGGAEKIVLRNFSDLPQTINAIFQMKNGEVWVGGVGGIAIFHPAGNREWLADAKTLPGKTVYCIGQDQTSNEIWLTGSDGIKFFHNSKWRSYGLNNGLLETECNRDGLLINEDGTVLVGTMRSLAVFSPREDRQPDIRLQPFWQELPDFEEKGGQLLTSPARASELNFRWHTPFLRPHEAAYRIKISGHSEDWSSWRPESYLMLAGLRPGMYAITVQARVDDGIDEFLSSPLSIKFYKKPAFYQTVWARVILISALVTLVAGSYYLRVRILKRRGAYLEQLVNQRTQELAETNQVLQAVNRQLKEISARDYITGLLNRREIEERLGDYLSLMERQQKEIGILFFDIDYFKQINDTLGHEVGDRALKIIGECITKTFRQSDLCGRLGGDEFLVVFPATSRREMSVAISRFLNNLAGVRVEDGRGEELKISISGGATNLIPDRSVSFDRLFRVLDKALYTAKQRDRGQIVWVEPPGPGPDS
ncbi:MAG: GGDEF domain protein [Candidatus Saccharicenans subterraneus]|uniref:GGDEF domain protein n=1 Tax=Candidatus Saccharicenans subterraneus TaxID=2508984 RepID=A0A3E2BLU6_9BACT|nr:MAG: GGDEF domain protein [Candidatus Saccharicenans subterraneum]